MPILRFILIVLLATPVPLPGQSWAELMDDPKADMDMVRAAFEAEWEGREPERGKGQVRFKRWEWFMDQRSHPTGRWPDAAVMRQAWEQKRQMEQAMHGRRSVATWQPLGPTSWETRSFTPGLGRLNVVEVSPLDPNVIFAGAASGGLWRTTDGGATWEPLFDDLPDVGVTGIALHPTDPMVVYAGTGDGHWRDSNGLGVLKSNDGGATWQPTGLEWDLAQIRRTRALRMHPTNPDILLCATNHGIWRTDDAGAAWTRVAEGNFRDIEFKPGDPSVVYASSNAFFRSLDGGNSFSQVATGLAAPSQVIRMELAVTPADPEVVYAVCGRSDNSGFRGLYRSTDGGASFSLRSSAPNILGYQENGGDSGGQSWFDLAICADPQNADRVFVGGVNVWRSENGGQNWTIRSHWVLSGQFGYTHADIHDLVMKDGKVYCASDGGLFTSDDQGASWTDLSAGLNITQFYAFDGSEVAPELIIAGAQDNGTNLREDDGIWYHVISADGMQCHIDPADPSIMYGSTQNGGLRRSLNGGISFSNITSGITESGAWVTPFVVCPSQPERLYAGFRNIWRSTDRGSSWTSVSNFGAGQQVHAIGVAPSDALTVYCATQSILRRSFTGGAPWTNITAGLPQLRVTSIAVHPHDPQLVYVSLSGQGAGEKVYVSSDAGSNWVNISRNLPNAPVNSIALDHEVPGGIYVGTDVGVFYSDSTLALWQPFSHGLPQVVVTQVQLNHAIGKLRASTYGRGLWESDKYQPSGDAPVAAMRFAPLDLCDGQTVRFEDVSTEAGPDRMWSFPGGIPESSTALAPEVVYPTSGTYQATLAVENAFGPDQTTVDVPVQFHPYQLSLSVTFDDFANETAWTIEREEDGAVVAWGGPFTGHFSGSTVQHIFCLPAGCYVFTMRDYFGDGMCCAVGNGAYQLAQVGVGALAGGGSFTFEDPTPFCLGSTAIHTSETQNNGLILVPNPARDIVVVLREGAREGQVRLFDLAGRVVRVQQVQGWRVELPLQGMAPGVYLVDWSDGSGRWNRRLVVE